MGQRALGMMKSVEDVEESTISPKDAGDEASSSSDGNSRVVLPKTMEILISKPSETQDGYAFGESNQSDPNKILNSLARPKTTD